MNKQQYVLALTLIVLLITAVAVQANEPWKQIDFEGRKVDVSYTTWFHPGFTEGRERAHLEWVEEAYNVQIGFDIPFFGWPVQGTVDGLLPKVIAGESDFMFKVTDQVMQALIGHGLLLPLDDAVDLEAYYARLPRYLSEPLRHSGQFLGKTYGFQVGPPIPSEAQGVIWNMDLFEREGLPDLYDLHEAGEWTWDAFKQIAILATKDTTGDGEIDQWGIHARHGPPGEMLAVVRWVYHNDGAIARNIDGRVVITLDEPAAIEALEYWHELVTVHNVVNKAASFTDGKVAMSLDNPGAGGVMDGATWENMNDRFGFVPVPKGPRANSHVAIEEGKWLMALPVTARNPADLIELNNALFRLTTPYIEDMDTWAEDYEQLLAQRIIFHDRQSFENFLWLTENTQPMQLREIINAYPGFVNTIDDIVLGRKTAPAAIAEILPGLQAQIDDLFGE